MSFESLLVHRADIYRQSIDAPTGPEPGTQWAVVYTDVPCRVQTQQVKELNRETAATVFVTLAFFPYSTIITEGDRVICDSVTYDVEGVDGDVAGAAHHKQVQLRAVR